MIIQNGTIETRTAAQGGTDPGTGYPVNPAETPWGSPIPCQYSAVRYDRLAKADGERATEASYSILIEEQPVDERAQLRLKDMAGKTVGEYHIRQIEPLDAVCQLRITV